MKRTILFLLIIIVSVCLSQSAIFDENPIAKKIQPNNIQNEAHYNKNENQPH